MRAGKTVTEYLTKGEARLQQNTQSMEMYTHKVCAWVCACTGGYHTHIYVHRM